MKTKQNISRTLSHLNEIKMNFIGNTEKSPKCFIDFQFIFDRNLSHVYLEMQTIFGIF